MAYVNVAEIFSKMSEAFRPDKAVGQSAIIQFDITGPNGGKWYAKIEDGACSVADGETQGASLTLIATDEDYLSMMNGAINPMTAFMQGKVKAKGDMTTAMKLTSWFGIG
jgi:putative sterol carrier protein